MDLTDKKYRQDFWKGTSQPARLLDELKPDYVQVDELSLYDLVKFTDEYAKHIIFHKRKNDGQQHQHWQEFFKKDSLYLLFFISNTNLDALKKDFNDQLESAYKTGEYKFRKKDYGAMVTKLKEMSDNLDDWNKNIGYDKYTEDLLTNLAELLGKINAKYLTIDLNKSSFDVPDERLNIISDSFHNLFSVTEYVCTEAGNVLQKILQQKKDNKSYMSLFIAFLQLYKHAQGEINQITRKHLEFYYTQVLRQSPNDTTADKAYICASLAKNVEYKLLGKGLLFDAGKASDGKNIYYELLEDTTVTDIQIKQIHTLFVSRNKLNYSGIPQSITDIFYHKNLSPADRLPGWATFGEDQFFLGPENKTMDHAPIGFIIASDVLHLSEGKREILITLEFEDDSYKKGFKALITSIADAIQENYENTFNRIFATAFDLYVSLDGKETRTDKFSVVDMPQKNGIGIHFSLSASDAPLIAPPFNKILEPIPLKKPFVKLLLRSESHIYAYPLVNILSLKNITIDVNISQVNNLTMYNDLGPINPILPFAPFGLMPTVGSSFYIGSNEIFSKKITHLSLEGRWSKLPQNDNGWKDYFCGYDTNVQNSDYQIAVSYLQNGAWHPIANRQKFPLFEERYEHDNPNPKLSEIIHFQPIDITRLSLAPYKTDQLNLFGNKTKDGYIKLEFISPTFAFAHSSYAKRLSEVAFHNATYNKEEENPWPDPAVPFTPFMDRLSVGYKATVSIFEDDKPTNEIDLYRITPFGYRNISLKSNTETVCLLEPFDDEGNLYLGFDKYPKNGYLNLFFHLMEGRVEDYLRDIPTPKWQYLANNTWEDFEPANVISDTTNSFIRSGIVRLQIPSDILKHNTILDENLFWIKISLQRDSVVAADVNRIYTNALTVQWNEDGDKQHLEKSLPPYTISKLKDKMSDITGVIQPIASIDGKKIEQTNYFYQRVSERLRHKHRAVNVWDYERLVLNEFPLIHRVKCFTANTLYTAAKTKVDKKHVIKPGHLKIVIIPDIYSPQVRNMLRPKVGINHLKAIQCYLKEIASSFSEIDVSNPFYERVKVLASVNFKTNSMDEGYYTNLLNDELKSFLTPWLWDKDGEDHFGNSVFGSRVLSYIQNRPYVDFVSGFSLVKTINDEGTMQLTDTANMKDNEELKSTYPWSILVSADEHDIRVIKKDIYIDAEPRSIKNMVIGSDFIITQ